MAKPGKQPPSEKLAVFAVDCGDMDLTDGEVEAIENDIVKLVSNRIKGFDKRATPFTSSVSFSSSSSLARLNARAKPRVAAEVLERIELLVTSPEASLLPS